MAGEYYKNCNCPDCTAKRLSLNGGLYGPFKGFDESNTLPSDLPRTKLKKPSADQVGGSHYKNCAIQPSEFIHKNNLGWCEGNVIKYVCRHQFKNGKEDIKKAIHYLKLILQWVYNEGD